jgi:tRNA threonylcarbamoyladenosine biosynthesis protein TsaB
MPSLAQLLTTHGNLLVLDAVSTHVQVGLLQAGKAPIWLESEAEAGSAIFALSGQALASSSLKMTEIAAFAFCEGPGSMLGTRTVAMALRTWQTLAPRAAYSYQSLAIASRAAWRRSPRAFAVIADARRDTWNYQAITAEGNLAPLTRIATAALPSDELLTLENFRAWSQPPPDLKTIPYRLADIFASIADDDCFQSSAEPDAFQHEAPEYKKWSAQIHSAATSVKK